MIEIREAMTSDWPAVWAIVEPVFRAGETYAVAADITEDEARAMWMDAPQATFVAVGDIGDVLGTYYIKPNQSGPGAHVMHKTLIRTPPADREASDR